MEKFKDILKELRAENGISMQELAAAINVSNASICKWENGITEPKVDYILRLSKFFNCSTDYLLGKTDEYAISKNDDNLSSIIVNAKERQLIITYRQLSEDKKILIQRTVNAWNSAD